MELKTAVDYNLHRLGQEGAKVVVSSRKEANVSKTVDLLQSEGHTVTGTVCNVALEEDREALFQHVEDTYGGKILNRF